MNRRKLLIVTVAALIAVNFTACSFFKAKNNLKAPINNPTSVSTSKSENAETSTNSQQNTSTSPTDGSVVGSNDVDNTSIDSSSSSNSNSKVSKNKVANNSSSGNSAGTDNNNTSDNSSVSSGGNPGSSQNNNSNNNNNSGGSGNPTNGNSSGNQGNTGNTGGNSGTGEDDSEELWSLVWSDEFNGKALDSSKWNFDMGNAIVDANGNKVADGWGNNEKQYYTNSTSNVFLKDGQLNIKANKEKVTDQFGTDLNYTSGKIKTLGKFAKKYGKVEIKAKLPQGKGFWPAIWMLPESDVYGGWAASGEIDIMEAWGSKPEKVAGTLHYGSKLPNRVYSGKEYSFPEGKTISDDFHTYSLEWEPGEIRWYVDGNLYQTQNNWFTTGGNNQEKYSFPAPFDQNFYLILNLAVGGNWDGEPDASTQFSQPMQIDYVRVYDLTGREYKTPVEPVIEAEPLPVDAKIPTADGNYIYNGDFKTNNIQENAKGDLPFGTGWNFVHIPDTSGSGSVSVDTIEGTNYAKVNVTSGGSQDYAVQLIQLATLGKGRYYKLSYDAKTDTTREIGVKLSGGAAKGWTTYTETYKASLTSDIKHFEKTFQMQKDSDSEARLEFELGLSTKPVWIGNVRLEEVPAPTVDYNASKAPLADGNRIYNGAFDKGTIDRMTYWNFSTSESDAAAVVPENTREMTVNIKNGGKTPSAITLNQKGIQLAKDSDYKLTFKAKSDTSRTIQAAFLNKDGSINYSSVQTINLTSSMEEHTLDFRMTNATDNEAQVVFNLGGNNSDVYIDDVFLIQTTVNIDYSLVDLYPLKNGNFSNELDSWTPLPNIGDGAASEITVENGEAKVAINNVGPNPWSLMLNQEGLKLSKGVEYILAFDVKASIARNMEAIIENAAYTRYISKTIEAPAGSEFQHYEFTFKMEKDDTAALKFLMGKTDGAVSSLPHEVYIDNVVFEVSDAKFISSIVKNGTFNESLTPWTSWTGDGGTADVSLSNDGAMKVSVTNAGPNSWSVQALQEGLKFDNGQKYSVSFKAKADTDRKMNVNIGKALSSDPWYVAFAGTQTVDLTDTMKDYTYEFTMNEESYDNGKIVFELGNVLGGNAATNVYIDDVAINKIANNDTGSDNGNPGGGTDEPTKDSSTLIQNGTFDNQTSNWIHYKADWTGAYSTFAAENGEAKVHIDYEGPENWSTQLAQENLTLEKGKTYVLSFDARSSLVRNIQAIIEENGGAYTKYMEPQIAALTTDMNHYTFKFTMNGDTDSAAHLVFALGKIDGNTSPLSPHDIFIDNVVLAENNLILNGAFNNQVSDWIHYKADWTGAYSTFAVENGEAKLHIDYEGPENWSTQLAQENLTLEKGKTYVLSFDARSSLARNIQAIIEQNGGAYTKYMEPQIAALTTDMNHYTFEFTMNSDTDSTAHLVFALGKIDGNTSPLSPHDIFIDNVVLEMK